MGDNTEFDEEDYMMAKKCLKSIFRSIQKVPAQTEKKKKVPRKRKEKTTEKKS